MGCGKGNITGNVFQDEHGDLQDMPDTNGTNSDHDPRYVAPVDDVTAPRYVGDMRINPDPLNVDPTDEFYLLDGSRPLEDSVRVITDNAFDLGESGVGFRDFYLKGNIRIGTDSKFISFGTGNDFSITYNGSNAVYNSAVVGTGNHLFTGGFVQVLSDSDGLVLGLGADASIKYDATDVVYNSRLVGIGDHSFVGGNVVAEERVIAEDNRDLLKMNWRW